MKVLAICPNPLDATSYYRAWGAFPDLTKRHGIQFVNYKDSWIEYQDGKKGFCWPVAVQYDWFMMQRGFGKPSVELATYIKQFGSSKLWYDLDDNLWDIPEHYKIKQFFPKSVLDTINDLIKMSDLVTVSTEHLKKRVFEETGVTAYVVNNGVDLKRFPINDYHSEGSVIWRGSNTHVSDLRTFKPILEEIGKETEIEFWGYDPVKDLPLLSLKNKFQPPLDVFQYFDKLKKDKPSIILTPLAETPFNESKSNIAWLEITMAGGVSISNQWGEFKNRGFNFSEWGFSKEQAEKNHKESKELIHEFYSLEKMNDIRAALLHAN